MEIVAAITDNFVIGQDGDMPWHLPADLAHFKSLTSGHVVVMGRRTWESIEKALPDRINIVVTRQEGYEAAGATVVHSLGEARKIAGTHRLFVIGGGEIYASAMPHASHLHLTRIHTSLEGDTVFPQIDESQWVLGESRQHPADESNRYPLTFEHWIKAE
jgi:dihydrofolate reductase